MKKITTIILFCLLIKPNIILSINNELSTDNERDTLIAKMYEQSSKKYFNTNQDSARKYLRKAIEIYYKAYRYDKVAYLQKLTGIAFAMQGHTDSATFYIKKSLKYYQDINDSLNIAFSYNNIGLIYTNNEEYEKGMKYLILALEVKKSLQNKTKQKNLQIGSTQNNIGIAFHHLKDYKKAKKYYLLAKKSCQQEGDSIVLYKAEVQIANLYIDTEKFDTAQTLYKRLLENNLLDKSPYTKAKIYNNYGNLLCETKHYNKALSILRKAYEMNKELHNSFSMVKNLNNLATAYKNTGHHSKATKAAKKAYQTSVENDYLQSAITAALFLSNLCAEENNFKDAHKYLEYAYDTKDSLFSTEQNETILELEAKYQNEEKQKFIEINNLKLAKNNKILLLTAIILTVFILASILFYVMYKDRQRKNIQLNALNSTKNKLFSIISHDLKNPAIAQKQVIEHLLTSVKKIDEDSLETMLKALYDSSKSQVNLLQNLLNWAKTQNEHIKYSPALLQVEDIVNSNVELIKTSLQNKNIELDLSINPPEMKAYVDMPMFNAVLRNLLSNAIKFSNLNSKISIDVKNLGNKGILTIVDEGLGMTKEKLNTLFFVKKRQLSVGTAGEEGSGIGLFLCKEMVKFNGGELAIKSEEGKGTEVSFTFPISK